MKNSLFCISLFTLTFVLLPMDMPPIQQAKKTKRKDSGRLLFSKEYPIGSNHMDSIAFLDDHHLMVGEPSKSMIIDVFTKEITDSDVSANHIVSYPEQKLIVVTNSKGVGVYHVSLQGEQKINEKATKKNTKTEVFSGRSFIFCGGKYLVTVKNKSKLKIYSYEDDKIGKSLDLKKKKTTGIKLYTGPNELSESLFFYQGQGYSTNNIRVAQIHKKKVLTTDVVTNPNDTNHSIRQLVVGPEGKSIAFLVGVQCQVLKGESFNKPICTVSPFHYHQCSVIFYTESLLVSLVYPESLFFMTDYRKLKVEFCDIGSQRIVFSKIIKSMPREGFWYAENPTGIWDNPSEIALSPDYSKYAVLWNNAVFVYTVPIRLWKQTPQFRTTFINRILIINRFPLCHELSLLITHFLSLLYNRPF